MAWVRRLIATVALGPLVWAAPAAAQTSPSTNWAGYAVHRSGESFSRVVGTWVEPTPRCQRGRRAFSSYWVGLGGFSTKSRALEQTGTEVDCTAAGRIRAFAWFELVPAASVRVGLRVPPGDVIQGSVEVAGRQVHVSLHDLTRHTVFSKVLQAGVLDVSSAEWIVEAPSDCLGNGRCVTLPLANFHRAMFSNSSVQATRGYLGSILDPSWETTGIRLTPEGQRYASSHRGFGRGGGAKPSSLRSRGSAFTVSFSPQQAQAGAAVAGPVLTSGRLVHRTGLYVP